MESRIPPKMDVSSLRVIEMGLLLRRRRIFRRNSTIGRAPIIDYITRKNPVMLYLNKLGWYTGTVSPTVPFAMRYIEKRHAILQKGEAPANDLLAKFLMEREENPKVVTDQVVFGMSLSVINAGADTTAIALSGLFYHLLKNPECYRKLQQEIDSSKLDTISVPFRAAQELPYLDACVKEGFRIHPSFVIPQERVTPPTGALIAGIWVPGNTVVACNSWTINRDPEVFGEDSSIFRPERWLESEEKKRMMNSALLHFGAGSHHCIGKNIALMEIYKLVPSFLRYFHVELVDQQKAVEFRDLMVLEIVEMPVRVRRRV